MATWTSSGPPRLSAAWRHPGGEHGVDYRSCPLAFTATTYIILLRVFKQCAPVRPSRNQRLSAPARCLFSAPGLLQTRSNNMRKLLMLILKYYLPIVAVFSVVSFLDSEYRADLPLNAVPLERMVTAILENATFSSKTLRASWRDFKYSDMVYGRSKSSAQLIIALMSYVTYGFIAMNILQIPIFLYVWVKREPYTWGVRCYSVFWDRPIFRHVSFLIKIVLCLLLILVANNNMSLVETAIFTMGAFWATRRPIIIFVILNIVDLYKLNPPQEVVNFFSRLDVDRRAQTTPTGNASSTTRSNTPAHTENNRSDQPKRRTGRQTKKPSGPDDWRGRIN